MIFLCEVAVLMLFRASYNQKNLTRSSCVELYCLQEGAQHVEGQS